MHICRTVHWDSVELVNRTVRRVVQRYLPCRPCDRIMIESWSNFNATVSHLIALTPATILTNPPRIIFRKYWLASPQFFLHLSITPHFRHTLIFCCNNCQPPDHRRLSYTGNFCITMASTLTSHLLVYGWALHVTTVNTSSRNSQAPLQELLKSANLTFVHLAARKLKVEAFPSDRRQRCVLTPTLAPRKLEIKLSISNGRWASDDCEEHEFEPIRYVFKIIFQFTYFNIEPSLALL